MKWRKFTWLVIPLLIFIIVWLSAEINGAYEKIDSAKSGDADNINQHPASLQKRIANYREQIEKLEKFAIWQPGADVMSWLTQQANKSGVGIIGVEHLPTEEFAEYQHIPIKITIRGDYNPLGRFINKLEHSPNAVRINSFRIKRKEYTPKHITMDLSLSYFQKVGMSS